MKGKFDANAARWLSALKLPLGACLLVSFAATGSWARQCRPGQFYRVSKHICISRAEAEKLGIYHRPAEAKKAAAKPAEEHAKPTRKTPQKSATKAVKPEPASAAAKSEQAATAPPKEPPTSLPALPPPFARPAAKAPSATAVAIPAAPSPYGSLTIETFRQH